MRLRISALAAARLVAGFATAAATPALAWDKAKLGAHCTTPKKSCTFADKKPRPLGTGCICRSQPKIKGKVTA
jgi:hypothetical protein